MGRGRSETTAAANTSAPHAPITRQPRRTCVGCRGTGNRSDLLRIVVDETGTALVLDSRKAMPGRGAWLHPDASCLSKAMTRRVWNRALRLRTSVDTGAVQNVLVERLSTASPSGDTPQESQVAVPHDHDRKRV